MFGCGPGHTANELYIVAVVAGWYTVTAVEKKKKTQLKLRRLQEMALVTAAISCGASAANEIMAVMMGCTRGTA